MATELSAVAEPPAKDTTGSTASLFPESAPSSDSTPSRGGGALSSEPEIDIFSVRNCGFLLQYFSVGLIYGGLPATIYGFFLGYLAVPAHVYSTVRVIVVLPWSFKFAFGLLNDTRPLLGYRRKPYMVIGWACCSSLLLLLAVMPLPEPYWCLTDDGLSHNTTAPPCNPHASMEGGFYATLMMLAALGYVVADVAADGLTVEFARREPAHRRGRTQTTAYMVRTVAVSIANLLVGFGMNGPEYNGTFASGLSFSAICAILAVPSALMVPVSWLLIDETRGAAVSSTRKYLEVTWTLLRSRAMFQVVLFQFCGAAIFSIQTPATGLVKEYFAGVKNLQANLFGLAGNLLFVVGLWAVRKHGLHYDWRWLLFGSQAVLQFLDMPFQLLTIYGIVRNQYFYLGETFLTEIPDGVNFVVSTFVIVEMAESGNEGLVYGLLTTTYNLGSPFGRALGNQIYAAFEPSLDDAQNYVGDSATFRNTVAASFALSYFFAFAAQLTLLLLPGQKEEAQRRKRMWPRRTRYAVISVVLVAVALAYSLTINFLSVSEATQCLRIVGGHGCEEEGEET